MMLCCACVLCAVAVYRVLCVVCGMLWLRAAFVSASVR